MRLLWFGYLAALLKRPAGAGPIYDPLDEA